MNISAKERRLAEIKTEQAKLGNDLMIDRIQASRAKAAYQRQRRMNVVTICNTEWLDTHTERFIRLARRAMPDASYTLVHVGKPKDAAKSKTANKFDRVVSAVEKKATGYLHYNAIRYTLCETLGMDEVVYIDPDVDIVADISHILEDCEDDIGWCRSPVEPAGFGDAMLSLGLGNYPPWANSGTLVIRGNFSDEYLAAAEKLVSIKFTPRMIGNAAFSVMLRQGGISHSEIPYKYGTIWWDNEHLPMAQCVHYCNDHGKARRMALDAVWVDK